MHELVQSIIHWYLGLLHSVGYLGVVLLMAMESTIFPVPSEFVVPPAAYLFAYEKGSYKILQAVFVVLAGTVGSYLGSAATYLVSHAVGRPLIVKYGRYFFIPEKKLKLAEEWVGRYGAGGIFFARLLPVVRHLISIPAGIVGMNFTRFSVMTISGSLLWCSVLTVFGLLMAQDMEAVLKGATDSVGYKHAFHNLTFAVVGMVAVLGVLYVLVVKRSSKGTSPAKDSPAES